MGKVGKGKGCDVAGCGNQAERSMPLERALKAGLNVKSEGRAYLCGAHYKEMKKKLKKEGMIEKFRWKR